MSVKTMVLGVGGGVVVLGGLFLAFGHKEEPVAIAPVASSLAPSTVVATAKVVKFTIDPAGKTTISMPAPKENIKAVTEVAAGNIDVDLMNLANTRGEVKVDVTSLSTHTFGTDDDAAQTKHALTWLEVGEIATPEQKEANRWAVYAIRSIDQVSATDITKVLPLKEGAEDVRVVTLTAKGDFLLHGHKVENREAQLEARLHYPSGAAADSKPSLIELKSKAPLRVTLAEHDVKARDTFGKLATKGLDILGTKVATVADVSIDLRAKPGTN
jgi:hypothetical protein